MEKIITEFKKFFINMSQIEAVGMVEPDGHHIATLEDILPWIELAYDKGFEDGKQYEFDNHYCDECSEEHV